MLLQRRGPIPQQTDTRPIDERPAEERRLTRRHENPARRVGPGEHPQRVWSIQLRPLPGVRMPLDQRPNAPPRLPKPPRIHPSPAFASEPSVHDEYATSYQLLSAPE